MSRIWWRWRCLSWRKGKGRDFLKGSLAELDADPGFQVGLVTTTAASEALCGRAEERFQVGERGRE